ncbi:MAG: cytochrome c [Vicinamibacterales bacterium]
MKLVLKALGILLALLVVVALGVYVWAGMTTDRVRAQTFETHSVDFPIPFPLDPQEIASLGLTDEAARQLAQERAVARGKHLVEARYPCVACHSATFGGGVMVDAFPIGHLLAPNLTLGTGSRTANFTPRDWDRIVRHGVLSNGRPAVMPSEDFQSMSDQELSDIVSYIRTMPPVNNTVAASTFGPLGKILVATGQIKLSASVIKTHNSPHAVRAPAEASAEFGRHLAAVCSGCHGSDFSGGPIQGGDPSWPPARNLTPDATGLGGWTYDQFVTAVARSQRPDGTALRPPMTFIAPYGQNMTDVERHALWSFLQSLPPVSKKIAEK